MAGPGVPTVSASSGHSGDARAAPGWLHYYPALFAIYPVLTLWAANVGMVSPWSVALLGTAVGLGTVLFQGVLRLSGASDASAGLTTLTLVAAFFGLPHVVSGLESLVRVDPTTATETGRWVLYGAAALAFVALRWTLGRLHGVTRSHGTPLAVPLAIAGVVAAALPALRAADTYLEDPPALVGERPEVALRGRFDASGGVGGSLPDVYWIVLDGYARADVLRSHFGFDNGPFVRFLERRGFRVAEEAWANYVRTDLTVASMLNATYLEPADVELAVAQRALTKLIDDPWFFAVMRRAGYGVETVRAVPYRTVFPDGDGVFPADDVSPLEELAMSPLLHGVLAQTAAGRPATGVLAGAHRRHLERGFDRLASSVRSSAAAGSEGREPPPPKLVYAHLLLPHQPFVFAADGSARRPHLKGFRLWYGIDEGRNPEDYREGYVGQLRYTNARLAEVLERILASSSRPVAVVLMGDHGSALGLHRLDVDKTDLRERLAILAALRLPGCEPGRELHRVQPVNVARLLVLCYLDPAIEPLPRRAYYSPVDRPTVYVPLKLADPPERFRLR